MSVVIGDFWGNPTKECPKCRVAFLGWDEIDKNFHKDSRRPDGYHAYCKFCRNRKMSVKDLEAYIEEDLGEFV